MYVFTGIHNSEQLWISLCLAYPPLFCKQTTLMTDRSSVMTRIRYPSLPFCAYSLVISTEYATSPNLTRGGYTPGEIRRWPLFWLPVRLSAGMTFSISDFLLCSAHEYVSLCLWYFGTLFWLAFEWWSQWPCTYFVISHDASDDSRLGVIPNEAYGEWDKFTAKLHVPSLTEIRHIQIIDSYNRHTVG